MLNPLVAVASLLVASGLFAAPQPKRVLVVHSFGSVAPPFTTHSIAFETELVDKMGERVDLDEVSLDMARYSDPNLQEALVEYLQKRQAHWQPDLVVPIGSPAGLFVAQYRDRLFPETPILYTGMDRRRLPPDALEKNAAFIGESYDVRAFIEDILQIAPATKNIAVVIGASAVEQYWAAAFRKEFEPFANRINFIWLNDLSLDQMLEKTKELPPDSYIFLILLLRDATGVTHNADEALQRIHAVANAPINGIFQHQLGLGIVGGRLYQAELEGIESARIAVRILRGEPASSFPPKVVGPLSSRYDWRELVRWKIDQKRLPAGSTILFRTPSLWEQYRGWIIAGVSVFIGQALLIAALLANLFRRRRAERSLMESEQRFQNAADAAPVLMWMAGPDKRATFFNKAWLAFTGRTMEQELGDGWAAVVHEGEINNTVQRYHAAFDTRQPFVIQNRLRRHDGEFRWVTASGAPRYDGKGTFLGYVGASIDITDLLKKEEALHESEERIALAAEAAHLGVWELDTKTNEFWLSDQARRLFQFERETEITYSILNNRVHPEDRASREESIRRAIDTQSGYEIEYRILLPDQTVRWIAGRGRYLNNHEPKHGRLLGVSVDVTERKQTEQLFQLAAEGSHLGVWEWDETTGKLSSDRAMREIFDVPREGEITLETFYGAIYPHDLDRVKQVWRGAVESGQPYELEYRVQRSNGAIGWVHARGRGYYDDQDKPLRMIGIAFDITDRKQAEEEADHRREQIELLGRVSLLGEMTASLAHELNQPLYAILNNANAGMNFIDKGKIDPVQVREILADVLADGRRAHDIIQNVRDSIKKGSRVRHAMDLNEVVKKVGHMIQPEAAAHSCNVKLSLAVKLPFVEGDPTQMEQVLINLVSNALDAMRDTLPGQRRVEIETSNGDSNVHVSVRDYGGGVVEGSRERLFEHFFTTKKDGLGMGLAIVRSIVEAHGGKIDVENAEGGGARFSFCLPAGEGTPT